MAENNDQERSHPASPRRLERSREEGRTARSRELVACLMLLCAGLALAATGPQLAQALGRLLARSLRFDRQAAFSEHAPLERLGASAVDALLLVAPLVAILALAALAGTVAVGGWVFSAKALGPDFGRMSPLRGFSRLFSIDSLAELGKAIAKAALVGAVALLVFHFAYAGIAGASRTALESAVAVVSGTLVTGFLALAASLVLIAAIDVPFVLWRHARELRMTREEVREELRETEGDPQIRMRVRSLQREMARRRMMAEVPKADVVVTNPAHYAVALAYRSGMRAPCVVAKGAQRVALHIRRIAEENGVPVLESPALARSLYRHVPLEAPVPVALYDAVAQVLAWVYQLRAARQGRAAARSVAPPGPIEVPPELAVPEDAGAPQENSG